MTGVRTGRARTKELWSAYEAAAATGGALCVRGGDPAHWVAEEWSARGMSIDTRSLAPGDLFVALKDRRDGHDFLADAVEAGAAAALVSRAPAETPVGFPLLVAGDTLEALCGLAAAARRRNFGKRIAVTGSAGKTSTKEILRCLLSAGGSVHAAEKSLNNHFGVPLTLARLPADADFSVFEIGMNHAGEITPLTRLVQPHAAIVTTVGEAHLEFFESTAGIAEAKAEIFRGLGRGGAAILPADNEHFALLKQRAGEAGADWVFTFGEHEGADARLVSYETDGARGRAEAVFLGRPLAFEMGAPGRHQAMNALAALLAAHAVGADALALVHALRGFGAGAGRGAQATVPTADGGTARLLDESYNANPSSMRAAFALLGAMRPGPSGRRIVVLGDMLELGPHSPALHAGLAEPLVAAGVDAVYCAGPEMTHLWARLPEALRGAQADRADALIPPLRAVLAAGDIVMVKGSNASKVGDIVKALQSGEGPANAAAAAGA